MTEEWRAVVGYEGLYEVSSLGRVRSLPKQRLLKPYVGTYGHSYVQLGGRGQKRRMTHRLVYEAFSGLIPEGMVVRHLDGNPQNNTPANLAIGTQVDNIRDCYSYGGKAGCGKLYREQVLEIRDLCTKGIPQSEIAQQFGISQQSVSNIKSGRTFSYIK